MTAPVYFSLREQLDQYSVGFPAAPSGVELKILEKLFTEEEAEMFLQLPLMLETAADAAARTGRDPAETAALLERMAEKGLIFRLRRGQAAKYAAAPFVVGSYEFQLNRLDPELARLVDIYMEEALGETMGRTGSLLRPIPVNRSVDVSSPVAPYEDAREILQNQKRIAVANCICREQKGLLDEACDKPREVCFCFGAHADYYIDRGMGREVDVDEALSILSRAEEAGLVLQPYNTVNPGGMCSCCGDCCGVLRALKKHPKPAELVVSNYLAVVDQDECVACEVCLERCQMEAIRIAESGTAEVDPDRCIGCGLCVTTCPSSALSLQPKPAEQRKSPPAGGREQMTELARIRGKTLVPLALADPKA